MPAADTPPSVVTIFAGTELNAADSLSQAIKTARTEDAKLAKKKELGDMYKAFGVKFKQSILSDWDPTSKCSAWPKWFKDGGTPEEPERHDIMGLHSELYRMMLAEGWNETLYFQTIKACREGVC